MYLSLHIKKSLLGLAKTPTSFIIKKTTMRYSDFVKADSYTIHINSSYCKLYLIAHTLPAISRE